MFNKLNLSSIIKNTLKDSGRKWLEKEVGTKFRKGRNITKAVELSILVEILEELKEIKAAIQGDNVKVEIEVKDDVIKETVEEIVEVDDSIDEEEEKIEIKEVDDSIDEEKEQIEDEIPVEEEKETPIKTRLKRIGSKKKGKKK